MSLTKELNKMLHARAIINQLPDDIRLACICALLDEYADDTKQKRSKVWDACAKKSKEIESEYGRFEIL